MNNPGMQAAASSKPPGSSKADRQGLVAQVSALQTENAELRQQVAAMQAELPASPSTSPSSAAASTPSTLSTNSTISLPSDGQACQSGSSSPRDIQVMSLQHLSSTGDAAPAVSGQEQHADSPRFARSARLHRWMDGQTTGEGADWLSHGPSLEQQLAELSDESLPELSWAPHTILQAQQAQIAEAEQRAASLEGQAACMRLELAHANDRLQAQQAQTAEAEQRAASLEGQAACMRFEHAAAAAGLQAQAADAQAVIRSLQAKLQRAEESRAADVAEAESIDFLHQELLAQAASDEPVSLQIAVQGNTERIHQLETEAEVMRITYVDELEQSHAGLQHQLRCAQAQLAAAAAAAEAQAQATIDQTSAAGLRIAELENSTSSLEARHSEDGAKIGGLESSTSDLEAQRSRDAATIENLQDGLTHAACLAAEAAKHSDGRSAALKKQCMQLRLQQSWLTTGAAVTTNISRCVFGARSWL